VGLGLGVAAALIGPPAARALARPAMVRLADLSVESDLTTKNCRTEASSLASVIADAIREVERADIALVHASAFADITVPKGRATAADILKALQFREDTVVLVNLTGEQVRRALENGLRFLPTKSAEFLQVSGLSVEVDPDADKEKRVTSVKAGAKPLDDKKTYKVAMPSPLANGALGYYKIWDKSKAIDRDTGKTVEDAVTDYLASRKTLPVKGEERIVFKK
jgi:2',3'-cyclic-nucleotide 2'-phosphodiesterase (5'-nucleotidase family)